MEKGPANFPTGGKSGIEKTLAKKKEAIWGRRAIINRGRSKASTVSKKKIFFPPKRKKKRGVERTNWGGKKKRKSRSWGQQGNTLQEKYYSQGEYERGEFFCAVGKTDNYATGTEERLGKERGG